ncbi:MAG: F0F1 ATP synthase subunit B [Acutalibacteraceae bacterium]
MDLTYVPVDLIIHIINIIVLFVLLRVILYNPVKKYMEARTARIEADKKAAETEKAESERLKADYEARLSAAADEAKGIIREKSAAADQKSEKIISDAKSEADKIIASAREEAKTEKSKAVFDSKKQIVALASEMASKILEREVNDKDNERLSEKFFSEMSK